MVNLQQGEEDAKANLQTDLFTLDHTIKHSVHATMMKDTKSAMVKKALDEEAREQIQNTERQVTRKKLNPQKTVRKAKLEP